MNKSTVARVIVLHIYLVLGLTILFGCVSGRYLVQDKSIIVKNIDSDWAYIEHVSIKQYGEDVILMGSVKRRSSGHGIVSDYLNVALSDPNGDVTHMENISYYHFSHKDGTARFRITLDVAPMPGSILTLSLHKP